MPLKIKIKTLFGNNKMKTLNLEDEQVAMLKSALNTFIDYIGGIATQVEAHCEENKLNKTDFIDDKLYADIKLAKELLTEL